MQLEENYEKKKFCVISWIISYLQESSMDSLYDFPSSFGVRIAEPSFLFSSIIQYISSAGNVSTPLFNFMCKGASLSKWCLCQRGRLCLEGSLCQGGLCPGGSLSARCLSGRPPPPCGQTDTCEIITLLQTSFAS